MMMNYKSATKNLAPFEEYYDVLGYIQNQVIIGNANAVLDIGTGTGCCNLTLKLDFQQ